MTEELKKKQLKVGDKSKTGEESNAMLEEHKKMLIMTGNLSDFQLNNLKTWPFIAMEGVDEVSIDYDFTNTIEYEGGERVEGIGAGKVVYNLKAKEVATKEQIEILKQWTRFLFWKDTEVEVNLKV